MRDPSIKSNRLLEQGLTVEIENMLFREVSVLGMEGEGDVAVEG